MRDPHQPLEPSDSAHVHGTESPASQKGLQRWSPVLMKAFANVAIRREETACDGSSNAHKVCLEGTLGLTCLIRGI
jgi:hypothetical protein